MAQRTCSVDGCGRPYLARGWCRQHYNRWWETGRLDEDKPIGWLRPGDRICSIEGCERPYLAVGYCRMHYQRAKAGNDMLADPLGSLRPVDGSCSVEGCDRDYLAQGLCRAHYQRMRAGTSLLAPVAMRGVEASERFWAKVERTADCWEWQGSRDRGGYGSFNALGVRGSPTVLAHRWAYEALVGPIPEGLVIDHLCENPPCCNPAHMEPVTVAENTRRGFERRRARQ